MLGSRPQAFPVEGTFFVAARQALVERALPLFIGQDRRSLLIGLGIEDRQTVRGLGDFADFFELQPALRLQLVPASIDRGGQRIALPLLDREGLFAGGQVESQSRTLFEGRGDVAFGIARAGVDQRSLTPEADEIGVHLAETGGLVPRRRLVTGRLFTVGCPLSLDLAEVVVDVRDAGIDPGQRRLDLGQPSIESVETRLLLGEGPLECGQLRRLFAVLIGGQTQPELAELIGDLAVLGRFDGLTADRVELGLDFVDDVGQPRHILVDALELAFGVEFARLEAADAGRLLEDQPPGRHVRLQDLFDPPLLDDAVAGRSRTRSQEEIPDVFEAARGAIDQVLRLAAAIDPPADLNFPRLDGKEAGRVVERQRGFRERARLATRSAVEDDVGHLLAAEALGALVAQDPLDRIDDVAFAAAVGSDDTGDSRSEIETDAVRKALETEDFERLQHEG